MRSFEDLQAMAHNLAVKVAHVGDHDKANEVAMSAIAGLEGESVATGMITAAFLLRGLCSECPDRSGFMATIIHLVAGAEPSRGVH